MNINVEECKIAEFVTGSNLYGTNTPESDIDICGIFVAPEDYYIGLHCVKEIDQSVISKAESGKNDKDAVDKKFYELTNFCRLALNCNPNIIETLFVPPEKILYDSPEFVTLRCNYQNFVSKLCYKTFMGYAQSQKHKMIIKKDNMILIDEAIGYIEGLIKVNGKLVHMSAFNDHFSQVSGVVVKEQHFTFGDCSVHYNDSLKNALGKLQARKNKFSSRYDDYISKSGYDTKFASHLVRLLYECEELLMTGEIGFPLYSRGLILEIKKGKYSIEEVMNIVTELEDRCRSALILSKLPETGNFKAVNNLCKTLVKSKIFVLEE